MSLLLESEILDIYILLTIAAQKYLTVKKKKEEVFSKYGPLYEVLKGIFKNYKWRNKFPPTTTH